MINNVFLLLNREKLFQLMYSKEVIKLKWQSKIWQIKYVHLMPTYITRENFLIESIFYSKMSGNFVTKQPCENVYGNYFLIWIDKLLKLSSS